MLTAYVMSGAALEEGGGVYIYSVGSDGGFTQKSFHPLHMPLYGCTDGGRLYTVSRGTDMPPSRFGTPSNSFVVSAEILPDGDIGEFTPAVNCESLTGCHISVGVSGGRKYLYTAQYSSASMTRIQLDDNGIPTAADRLVMHGAPDGTHGRFDRRAYLHQTPFYDGCVFAVDLGRDEVCVYDPDLNYVSSCSLEPGTGPRHIIFRGENAWTVNELTSTVCRFRWDKIRRRLTYIEMYDLLPDGSTDEYRLSCAGAAIRISGDTLYTCTRLDNSIASFDILPDGSLRKKQYIKCGGDWPRDIEITPDGRYLYSANEREGKISAFSVGENGLLSLLSDSTASVPSANNIIFSQS